MEMIFTAGLTRRTAGQVFQHKLHNEMGSETPAMYRQEGSMCQGWQRPTWDFIITQQEAGQMEKGILGRFLRSVYYS